MWKISPQAHQLSIANPTLAIESAQFRCNRARPVHIHLLTETILVTITAVLAIRFFSTSYTWQANWFIGPAILIAAALIPTLIRRSRPRHLRLRPSNTTLSVWVTPINNRQIGLTLWMVGCICAAIFPLMLCGVWLLKYWGIEPPLRPVLSPAQSLAGWLFYQFMYVAIAEEVFFRGYVQGNILRLTNTCEEQGVRLIQWISIIISAACFATAHIVVSGQMISALTFMPGIIAGWLFIRTRSLIGPILFHGLANTCYFLIAAVLV